MNPKSSRMEVLRALSICLLVALVLTSLVFTNESSLITTVVFIGLPSALILILILTRYLSSRMRERVRQQWKIFVFLEIIAHELLANRISVLIIIFLLALFFGMEQAQELLLHLADDSIAPPVFFGVLLLLSLLAWFGTRFMYKSNIEIFRLRTLFKQDYKEHLKHDNPEVVHIRAVLPKILGLIILLIPTAFILKLYVRNVESGYGAFVITTTGIMIWGVCTIVYAFSKVTFYEIIRRWTERNKWVVIVFFFFFVGIVLYLGYLGIYDYMNSPARIPWLYFSGGIVAVMYFLITSLHVERMFLKQRFDAQNRIKKAIIFGSVLITLLFILFNSFPLLVNANGLTLLFAGLIFYAGIGFTLVVIGGRIRVPVLTLFMIIGTAIVFKFAPNSGLHDVRLTADISAYDVDNRVDINTYIKYWLDDKMDEIAAYQTKNKPYPIIFVSSEGGGSRAALWTLLVHDTLGNVIPDYYDHIFSMSGASGGNTGNSFYLSFQEVEEDSLSADMSDIADRVFLEDFVSTDIGLLFGRDAWQSLFASNWWDDRSEVFQQKWESTFEAAQNGIDPEIENPLKREFLSFWYEKGHNNMVEALRFKHPLFLLNTTHVQSGDHATMSAVKIENFIPQNMDLLREVYNSHGRKSIPLSSGTLMNARFPIICPSGRIADVGNFVDAGYYDNIGAFETRAAIIAFVNYLNNPENGLDPKNFKLVHFVFRNGLPNQEIRQYVAVRTNRILNNNKALKQEPFAQVNYPVEAVVPVNALASAAFAHPNRELAEIHYLVDTTCYFDLARTKIAVSESDTVRPILPLSRHLSSLAVRSMHARLRDVIGPEMSHGLDAIFE